MPSAARHDPVEKKDWGAAESRAFVDEVAQVADCIDTLHSCVTGGWQPQDCAQAVRACVLAAVPAPDAVVPGAGSSGASQGGAGHAGAGHAGNTPDPHSVDAGRPSNPGTSAGQIGGAGAGMMNAADAGAAMSSPALQCLDAFQTCMKAGGQTRTCAQSLEQCNQGARP
jgi:hypothetical protein